VRLIPLIKTLAIISALLCILCIAIVGIAKVSEWKAENVIACAASSAWSCSVKEIQVEVVGPYKYEVSGCNRHATYACKGPADGCLLSGTRDVLSTWQCSL